MLRVPPQSNRNPIPRIDRRNHQRQIHRLHITELRPNLLISRIPRMPILNIRHRLCPGQSRPLPLRIKLRTPPPRHRSNPLLRLPHLLQLHRMQPHTILTPIHQRSPKPHQLPQRSIQPRSIIQVMLQLPHMRQTLRRQLPILQSRLHSYRKASAGKTFAALRLG